MRRAECVRCSFSIVREPRKKSMLLVGAEVRVRVSEVEDKLPILGIRDIIRWQNMCDIEKGHHKMYRNVGP